MPKLKIQEAPEGTPTPANVAANSAVGNTHAEPPARDAKFIQAGVSQFDKRVLDAGAPGDHSEAGPFLRLAERAGTAFRGIRVVMELIEASDNRLDSIEDGNDEQPIFTANDRWSLMQLARLTAELMVNEVEGVDQWSRKYFVRGEA